MRFQIASRINRLAEDFWVTVIVNVAGHLRIPNKVAVAIEDQEVEHPHDFNIRA